MPLRLGRKFDAAGFNPFGPIICYLSNNLTTCRHTKVPPVKNITIKGPRFNKDRAYLLEVELLCMDGTEPETYHHFNIVSDQYYNRETNEVNYSFGCENGIYSFKFINLNFMETFNILGKNINIPFVSKSNGDAINCIYIEGSMNCKQVSNIIFY